ncbi:MULTISPECIES: NACHT domain-containing protein [unclassified Saccharothrix]|uniref:NACHT domain-containing protein n=1 Tax=unclassified Saccharothrix TaxID=2593673 RepID=UPI00307CEB1E
MPDLTTLLLTAAASAAVKSVVPLAAKASMPAWRAAAESTLTQPARLRGLRQWAGAAEVRKQERALAKFLNGRLCTGLVEVYALGYASSSKAPLESSQLRAMFKTELARSLKREEAEVEALADRLWNGLTAVVKRGIDELKDNGAFTPGDMLLISRLNQRQEGRSVVTSAIAERRTLSADHRRVQDAIDLVDTIRREGRRAYSEMLMPHARESHRVPIDDLYVPRRMATLPVDWYSTKSWARQPDANGVVVNESELSDRRFVLIGSPGAGKTTFVRRLLFRTCQDDVDPVAPLLLELKNWTENSGSLVEMLRARLESSLQIPAASEAVVDALVLGLVTVVFDGLDEVTDIARRRALVRAIESFCRRYPLAGVVVSCRREGYESAPLDPLAFPAYQVPDFTYDQVLDYATNWFNLIARFEGVDPVSMRNRFMSESVHAAELRSNPLMLSLLCILYQYEGYIPENRSQVYEECAELLFGRWDRVRDVRTAIRADARGHHLVEEIAYYFFTHQKSQGGERRRVLHNLIKSYVIANLNEDEFQASNYAENFLDHCAGRAWLLTATGTSDRGERVFAFSHRTFMEYFAACYLARHAEHAQALAEALRPVVEAGASEVICQLAIDRFGERIAGGTDDVLRFLVFKSSTLEVRYDGLCLRFGVRSLEFLQPVPRTVRALVKAALRDFARSDGALHNTAVSLVPKRYADIVEKVCESVLSDAKTDRTPSELLRGVRTYQSISRAPTGKNIPWYVENAREVLVGKVLTGVVSVPMFRRAAGRGCLADMSRSGSAEKVLLGPLPIALRTAAETGFVSEPLEAMLRLVVRDPAALMPMGGNALLEFAGLLSDVPEWTMVQVLGAKTVVAKQPVVGFAHVCVAVALEAVQLGFPVSAGQALSVAFDVDFPEDALEDQSADDLVRLIMESPYLELSNAWRSRVLRVFARAKA